MAKKLGSIVPRVATIAGPGPKPPPKQAAEVYRTAEHRRWRAAVYERAGGRCQWPDCDRHDGETRMFADHIKEISDGGAPLDPNNGQLLCGSHHTTKTGRARAARLSRDPC